MLMQHLDKKYISSQLGDVQGSGVPLTACCCQRQFSMLLQDMGNAILISTLVTWLVWDHHETFIQGKAAPFEVSWLQHWGTAFAPKAVPQFLVCVILIQGSLVLSECLQTSRCDRCKLQWNYTVQQSAGEQINHRKVFSSAPSVGLISSSKHSTAIREYTFF